MHLNFVLFMFMKSNVVVEAMPEEESSTQSPPQGGRLTNQLLYIKKTVYPALWKHHFSWPFRVPVDPVKLELPVSRFCFSTIPLLYPCSLWH